MKIEVWSDVTCPFCYIGIKHLNVALKECKIDGDKVVEINSFPLNPNFNPSSVANTFDALAKKYNISIQEAHKRYEHVVEIGKNVGIAFNFDIAVPCNTMKANQLLQFADLEHKQLKLEKLLFQAYFEEGKDLNSDNILVELAFVAGLNRDKAYKVIKAGEFIDKINADVKQAHEMGVEAVPFFLIDGKAKIGGAQEPHVFINAIKESKFNI